MFSPTVFLLYPFFNGMSNLFFGPFGQNACKSPLSAWQKVNFPCFVTTGNQLVYQRLSVNLLKELPVHIVRLFSAESRSSRRRNACLSRVAVVIYRSMNSPMR